MIAEIGTISLLSMKLTALADTQAVPSKFLH